MKVQCTDCSWIGDIKECIRTYESLPDQDVVPVDECPKCGGTELLILPDGKVELGFAPA